MTMLSSGMCEHHPVKRPAHYDGDGRISCMDALRSMMSKATLPPVVIYWWGCAFKYLWRWHMKNGIQDIDKCMQCLKYMKEELEGSDRHDER